MHSQRCSTIFTTRSANIFHQFIYNNICTILLCEDDDKRAAIKFGSDLGKYILMRKQTVVRQHKMINLCFFVYGISAGQNI